MNLIELFKSANPLFYGLGKENQSLVSYLISQKIINQVDYYDENWIRLTNVDVNRVSKESIKDYSLIIKSPGISPYAPEFKNNISADAEIVSPNQLYFDLNKSYKVCVTGSKGKSTAVKLMTDMLIASGISAYSAGNIGKPLSSFIEDQSQVAVIELSSFQLQTLDFKAEQGLITVLFPEHLIWHLTEEQYFKDKLKIADGCKSVTVLDMADLDICLEFNPSAKYELVDSKIDHGNIVLHGGCSFNYKNTHFDLPHLRMALVGCLEIVSKVLNNFDKKIEDCQQEIQNVIENFESLPHRTQVIFKADSQVVVNDSIATVPEASIAAIDAFRKYPLVVFVGGQTKGVPQTKLVNFLEKASEEQGPLRIVCSGATGQEIYQSLGLVGDKVLYDSLKNALDSEIALLDKGYSFLLAPGATSFGEFENYAERGEYFSNTCLNYLK